MTIYILTMRKRKNDWQIGDYLRQFAVVAAGIIVTFIGSDLITYHKQQKEVTAVMQFIRSETEDNKRNLERLYSRVLLDQQMSKYMIDCDFQVSKLPLDTLRKYRWFISSATSLKYTSDALEVLKNSALMQQVSDKKMLLELVKMYEVLREIKSHADKFYEIKMSIIQPMMLTMSQADRDKARGIYYARYEMTMQNIEMQNFSFMAQGFFEESLFSDAFKLLDDNIKTLYERYP